MYVWEIVPVSAAVAWTAIVSNLVVIPFYNVREKWHKDYVDSGTLAQAEAYIDSEKLIPNLADIVDLVVLEKKTKTKVQTKILLETVDFLPCLEKVEAATREKSQLHEDLAKLQVVAKKIWKGGLAHIGSTVAAWIVFALLYVDPQHVTSPIAAHVQQSTSFWVAIIIVAIVFVLSAARVGWSFWIYDKRRDAFFERLKANRQ